jgi:PiT family inorganic phosphate transporter
LPLLTLIVGSLLAYANGSNDNFKGVATLFGSGTTSYRRALLWATGTTALGSLLALYLAEALLTAFTGRGLVPDSVVASPPFALSVAFGAGTAVLLATRLGLPISTTHALIGALVGVGLARSPTGIDAGGLSSGFVLPLLTSPFIAMALAAIAYLLIRTASRSLDLSRETCICIGREIVAVVPGHVDISAARALVDTTSVTIDTPLHCKTRYQGQMLGLDVRRIVDGVHFLSAGAVSFARGVNDTPKIAALLVVGSAFSPTVAIVLVATAIAAGGLISARRVAETMSKRITTMSPGQGLTANLVTAALVIGASNLGMPVSTTHVSCGSLFGIGASTGQARWRIVGGIALAWVVTLPVAAIAGVVFT